MAPPTQACKARVRSAVLALAALSHVRAITAQVSPQFQGVWPIPASSTPGFDTVIVKPRADFFSAPGHVGGDTILSRAFGRYVALTFPHGLSVGAYPGDSSADAVLDGLSVFVEDTSEHIPQLGVDESYSLKIDCGADGNSAAAAIHAKTVFGALRGLETFSQMVMFLPAEDKYVIGNAPWEIHDAPRFPHRGLMIDTGRHFLPMATIRAVVDSLAYAKLNVLHWHMTDTQSFPLEVRSFPKLWEGSFSQFERYTQREVREIVEYAKDRGIRVVPEFDMPGHAQSWCRGYPEACPSSTCTTPLNVASNATWDVIEGLLSEVTGNRRSVPDSPSGLFPDDFLHLGGDEVDTSCWSKTPSIQAWLQAHNLSAKDGYALFAKRAAEVAISKGRRPVQWAEVFDEFGSRLHNSTIIHVWKAGTDVAKVAASGYDMIRNVGYFPKSWYLDNLNVRWQAVYENDPCDQLPTDELCAKVLGGHGEMWGERIDGSNLEHTVWPKLAAIAEKLWSTKEFTMDPAVVEPRLAYFRWVLLERGVAVAPLDVDGGGSPTGPGPSAPALERGVAVASVEVDGGGSPTGPGASAPAPRQTLVV